MTYTLVGEKNLVQKEISKISNKFNSENISNYDLKENTIDNALEDLNTIGLFGDKLVIITNIELIDREEELIKYLNKQSSNVLIITSYKKLDMRKKLTKVLKEKSKLIELFDIDLIKYTKNSLKEYEISTIAINRLISYCNSDINRLDNEIEKLKMYKLEEKIITEDDIKEIVQESYESTIFNLIDEINEKNKKRIYKIYYELLKSGLTEDRILYTIANHYRLLFQIKCKLKDKTDDEIISEYNMHPYRLKKLKEQLLLMTDKDILYILKSLGDIDIKTKRGEIEIDTALILFFENL